MIKVMLFASVVNFQCFLKAMTTASQTELYNKNNTIVTKTYRPAKKKHLEFFLKTIIKKDPLIDERILALSWMESRMRPFVRRGDKGKACGAFQIHARHSYPMFRRKGGYANWEPKASRNTMYINAECRKLEKLSYSLDTLKKYLNIFDKKNKHACHHNSGVYGKCNTWYKKRVDYWLTYFKISKLICKENHNENLWAIIRDRIRLAVNL